MFNALDDIYNQSNVISKKMKALKAYTKGVRGQTSVEYLILLAIAIVIAVVAVGVLAGYIRIGTATTYKKKAAIYWKSADIGIMDWEIYPASAAQDSVLVFQNNKEYQIDLNWISFNGGSTTYALNIELLPGDAYKWTAYPLNCTADSSYSYEITFDFDNMEHNIPDKLFTGSEMMTGTCSSPI